MKILAFLLFMGVIVFIAVIVTKEHQAIYAMPLVKSALPTQGDEAATNRLFSPCPVMPVNIPFQEDRSA